MPASTCVPSVRPAVALQALAGKHHSFRLTERALLDTVLRHLPQPARENRRAVARQRRRRQRRRQSGDLGEGRPEAARQPDAAAGRAAPGRSRVSRVSLSYLETSLDRAAERKPDPGRTEALHRLNRAEYRNAVRDLLALDIDVGAMLPADDVSYGFDNIAGVQRMSPTLMERYIAAAQKISAVAVGASPRAATTDTFLVPPELRQDDRLEGLPFGTRGGTALRYTFPRDGVYSVRVQLTRYAGASFDEIPVFDEPQRLELSVDGTAGARLRARARTTRGTRTAPDRTAARSMPTGRSDFPQRPDRATVALTFLNRTPALLENLLEPFAEARSGRPERLLHDTEGRLSPQRRDQRPVRTPPAPATRRAASGFSCAGPSKRRCANESAAARRRFSRRWRAARSGGRSADADLQTLLAFYKEGGRRTKGSDFELGIERAVEGLLVSPEFLFRVEREPAGAGAGCRIGAIYRISDLELASRLSFFLWSSIPDDALLDAASSGKLRNPAVLEQQVRRMLADPRADALVTNFVGQWLFLRNLPTVLPDPRKRPRLRRGPAAGIPARNGAVRRQHPARGSQRARPADRELHVRERAAREALRHSATSAARTSAASSATTTTAAGCSATAACCRSPRSRIARRRSCAASGFSRTCSARRCRRRRRTCRR